MKGLPSHWKGKMRFDVDRIYWPIVDMSWSVCWGIRGTTSKLAYIVELNRMHKFEGFGGCRTCETNPCVICSYDSYLHFVATFPYCLNRKCLFFHCHDSFQGVNQTQHFEILHHQLQPPSTKPAWHEATWHIHRNSLRYAAWDLTGSPLFHWNLRVSHPPPMPPSPGNLWNDHQL